MQALVSRVDVACQTEDSCAASAGELEQARNERSALQIEVSSLRCAQPFLRCVPARCKARGAGYSGVISSCKRMISIEREKKLTPMFNGMVVHDRRLRLMVSCSM